MISNTAGLFQEMLTFLTTVIPWWPYVLIGLVVIAVGVAFLRRFGVLGRR